MHRPIHRQFIHLQTNGERPEIGLLPNKSHPIWSNGQEARRRQSNFQRNRLSLSQKKKTIDMARHSLYYKFHRNFMHDLWQVNWKCRRTLFMESNARSMRIEFKCKHSLWTAFTIYRRHFFRIYFHGPARKLQYICFLSHTNGADRSILLVEDEEGKFSHGSFRFPYQNLVTGLWR